MKVNVFFSIDAQNNFQSFNFDESEQVVGERTRNVSENMQPEALACISDCRRRRQRLRIDASFDARMTRIMKDITL